MNSSVTCHKVQDYKNAVKIRAGLEAVVNPLGGISAFVKPGNTVLLKPNFVKVLDPAQGGVTHPVVIAEMAKYCLEAGAKKILIGDSPGFGTAKSVAEKMGLMELIHGLPVEVIEFTEVQKRTGDLRNGCFEALHQSGEVIAADVLINLAKAKAHCQMVLTGATKNLFGCIPGRRKALMHCQVKNNKLTFGRMLVENAETLAPSLSIVDGVIAMQGMGPTSGTPYQWGWLFASTDFIALDRVLAKSLGYKQREIPHLIASKELHVGAESLGSIHLIGAKPKELLASGFEKAHLLPVTFNPIRLGIGYFKHKYQWYKREFRLGVLKG
ncbi:MAG: DUF362 domain-containing protein [Sumerlaeia bacterium]